MLAWILPFGVLLAGLRRLLVGYPAAPIGVQTLAAREYHVARIAAAVLYPPRGPIAASGDEARVALHTDRFVAAQTAPNRILMRLLLTLVEHATLVFPPHGPRGWRRFTSLSPDQQLAYLDGWRQSIHPQRRLVFLSLRAILTMGYFAHPGVLRDLGLAPRAIESPVIPADLLWPRVGRSPASIRPSPADLTGEPDTTPLGAEGPLHPEYR